MFCFPQQEHHSSTRILHSFRSHRSLRASAAQQPPSELYGSPESSTSTMHLPHFHHKRKPSETPTMSTTRSSSDSSRPSTSGGRSDTSTCSSIEWNPLRLHPPLAPAPRLHQQRSLASFQQHLQQQSQQSVPIPASASRPPMSSRGHSRSAPPASVIYDGFDFGFDGGEKSPSTASSSGQSTPSSAAMRRPGPPGGVDGVEHFIKRGGWKRRGIVFSPEGEKGSKEADGDEVFDLEC